MWAQIRLVSILFLYLFFLNDCTGCTPRESKNKKKMQNSTIKSSEIDLYLDPDMIFEKFKNLNYQSNLTYVFSDGVNQEKNFEDIKIRARDDILYVKKSTSAHEFTELYTKNDIYFVKNRLGNWRKSQKKSFYKQYISDNLNLPSWVVDNFSLYKHIAQKYESNSGKNIYKFKNIELDKNSQIISSFISSKIIFNEVQKIIFTGELILEPSLRFVKKFWFLVKIIGPQDHAIIIKGKSSLDTSASEPALIIPEFKEDLVTGFPVNIKKKFNELLRIADGE